MARHYGPQDLDPLDAAATPLGDDPLLRARAGVKSLEDTLAAMRADRLRREQEARLRAQQESDARLAAAEDQYKAERESFDPVGRPRLGAPLPGQNGRFQFRARGDGTEEVVEANPAASVDADFARWADEEPGSDRQRMYNPTGYAEAMAAREEQRLERAAAEQAKYGVASGENWRDNITDEQWQARADRAEVDRRQAENNKATRDKVRGTQRYQNYEGKQAKLEANRVQMQQNPFLTLGDPGLNEWQQFVLAQGMLGSRQPVMDPNSVRATHNQQMNRFAELFARNPGMMGSMPPGMADAQRRKTMEDAQADFDEWHSSNFGVVTPYTPGARDRRVAYMMTRFQISKQDAEAIADSRGLPGSLSTDGVTDGSAGAPTATPGRATVPAPHSMNGLPPIGR